MSMDKFIEIEKEDYGKLYADVIFALEKLDGFVTKEELLKRKFYENLPTLEAYIKLVKDAEIEQNSKGKLAKLFASNSQEKILEDFKQENYEKLERTRNCVNCECINCLSECVMEGCNRCWLGGKVASCDKKTTCVYTFKNKKIELNNDKTGETDMYNVLSIVQDKEYNQLFIIIELSGEKYVLYYYPGISEDTYGEISDVEDFNFALGAFEKVQV